MDKLLYYLVTLLGRVDGLVTTGFPSRRIDDS